MADLSVARFVSNFGQFLKFGIVGGSGTAVNLITSVLAKKWGWACFEACLLYTSDAADEG